MNEVGQPAEQKMEIKKILMIEDNANDVILTRRALIKAGIYNEIVVIEDGAEALKYIFKGDTCAVNHLPLVVMTDLNLPNVGGLDIIRKIRACEDTKSLPVVIMTASTQDKDRIDGNALGVVSYAQKPVSLAKFAEAIGELKLALVVLDPQELDADAAKAAV
jgi:CheY-like chemotaxis protein